MAPPMRMSTNCHKFVAKLQSPVMMLKIKRELAITRVRFDISASLPIGMLNKTMKAATAIPDRNPSCVSDQPKSTLIGRSRTANTHASIATTA